MYVLLLVSLPYLIAHYTVMDYVNIYLISDTIYLTLPVCPSNCIKLLVDPSFYDSPLVILQLTR